MHVADQVEQPAERDGAIGRRNIRIEGRRLGESDCLQGVELVGVAERRRNLRLHVHRDLAFHLRLVGVAEEHRQVLVMPRPAVVLLPVLTVEVACEVRPDGALLNDPLSLELGRQILRNLALKVLLESRMLTEDVDERLLLVRRQPAISDRRRDRARPRPTAPLPPRRRFGPTGDSVDFASRFLLGATSAVERGSVLPGRSCIMKKRRTVGE